MSMMTDIAAMSMSMNTAALQQSYSVAMAKNVMETQEEMATNILEMLPQQQMPTPPLGQYIDTYA